MCILTYKYKPIPETVVSYCSGDLLLYERQTLSPELFLTQL